MLRPEGAVHAHRSRAQLLKRPDRVDAVAAEIGRTVGLHRQAAQHRQFAYALRCVQRHSRLVYPQKRLGYDQVGARLGQRTDLLGVNVKQLARAHRTAWLERHTRGRQVARNERTAVRGLAAERNEAAVHFAYLVLEAKVLQAVPVGRKRRRIEDLRSRRNIGTLQLQKHLRMLQNPRLGAGAARQTARHQV